ncbi:unnamed protein product [Prorocentrum cordatum]|uniref:Uncharacterized protein n=1 Tax=Prorocentrum cordatum TaxID=2364126 RepID=A0ABN9XZI6_9DINO|nr:unnamed protein product [Polarella glacialis]
MAAGPLVRGGAASSVVFMSMLIGCVAERHVAVFEGGLQEGSRLAVVAGHRHLQRTVPAAASAAQRRAAEDGGRNRTLAHPVGKQRRAAALVGNWQRATSSPAAQGRGQNETLAHAVRRLNRTLLEARNGDPAADALLKIGRAPGGARALVPAVRGLALALTRGTLGRQGRWKALLALELVGPEAGLEAELAVPAVLHAAAEDESPIVRVAAVAALPRLLRPEAAERAGPVVLRAAEDGAQEVRAAAVRALPQLLGTEAAPVVLRLAAGDNATSVRQAAVQALLRQTVPEAVLQPVVLQVTTEDESASVRRTAWKLLSPDVAQRAVPSLLRNVSCSQHGGSSWKKIANCGESCWLEAKRRFRDAEGEQVQQRKRFRALDNLAEYFLSQEHAALEQVEPTLMLMLDSTLQCIGWDNVRDLAAILVIKISSALAGMTFTYRLHLWDVLIQAEEMANSKYKPSLRLRREALQRAFEKDCADSFLKQTGIAIHVDRFAVEIPLGVMMASDANGTEAHRCPNRDACPVSQRQRMKPARVNNTKVKGGSCPLLLSEHSGAIDKLNAICAAGFDITSPGCAKCLPEFGRTNKDPFSCEFCGKSGWAYKMAAWLGQPLIIFLLAWRSAESAAASMSVTEAVANDVVKIGLAYVSSIGVVVAAVTSTDSYHELNATDRARHLLDLAQQAQLGDITYSTNSDCLLMSGRGAASVDQLFALTLQLPACVLAAAAFLIVLRACCRAVFSDGPFGLKDLRKEVVHRMVTCSLVAGNQFLPSVVSASVRALPCFHTQEAVDGNGPAMLSAYDPDSACRENAQLLWMCGLGSVCAVVAGPVYWLTLLRHQKWARHAGPTRFLAGSYRHGFKWWEAVRLGKTMLIASVVTASPTSYCPLQQLMLCLLITGAFSLWHCSSSPYKYPVLNAAEAGSLSTLSVGMLLSGLLAGGRWPLTPSLQSSIIIGIASMLICYCFALVVLWVRVKFFWAEDTGEELPAEGDLATDQ